jgi:hypothetical protein
VEADDRRADFRSASAASRVNGARPGRIARRRSRAPASCASAARHAASRAASNSGGAWQKKLTLNGRVVPARSAASSARIASWESIAQGSEPSAPAFDTASASSLAWTPAIGA